MCHFLFPAFKIFFFLFRFQKFDQMCLGMDFLFICFFLFGVCSACWICKFISFAKLGRLLAITSWVDFLASPASSSPSVTCDSNDINSGSFFYRSLSASSFFQCIFSLLFRLGNFYCSVFKFLFFPLFSLLFISPSIEFFISLLFFHSKILVCFFFISSNSLLRLSIFNLFQVCF